MYEGITEIEWAQLAAWIDGEGNIGIRRNTHRRGLHRSFQYFPRVTVYNSNRRLMDWLTPRFGGCVSISLQETSRHKKGYVWELGAAGLVPVLRRILPYLLLKNEQAALVIDFYEKAVWHKGGNYKDSRKRCVSPEELARRHALYEESLRLNHRGPDGSD